MIDIEKQNMLALSVVILSVAVGATPYIVKETSIEKTSFSFDASVNVTEPTEVNSTEIGINPDPGMHFGNLPRGNNVTKYLDISVKSGSEVSLESKGNISELLHFDRKHYVRSDGRVSVEMKATEVGYFTGVLKVRVRRPLNRAGTVYLDMQSRLEDLL